jgi:hypothetical protein
MIVGADLARLRIVRMIFHDVPNRPRGIETAPILADLETPLDARRAKIIYTRLTQVIGSKHAYSIRFSPAPATLVPSEMRTFTREARESEEFVQMSRRLAGYLFAQHNGATSPGLLCVTAVTAGAKTGVAILKLERQEGAEIKFRGEEGSRVVDMDVLENLILTDKTRLFKSALFLRNGLGDDDFDLGACNSQVPGNSDDLTRFWLTYLGCVLEQEPRVATKRWFEVSLTFANDVIADAVEKNDFYEHLHSELKSNRRRVSPNQFIEDYVPRPLRTQYRQFLEENHVSLQAFPKDVAEISSRLRKRRLHTSHGISVSVPEEEERLVTVQRDQILVRDHLVSVDHK